jgi:hypothetical protein
MTATTTLPLRLLVGLLPKHIRVSEPVVVATSR